VERPKPQLPPLTDEQITQLQPGDRIFVKRFHRDGTLIRVVPEKKVALVSVGILEVEVPFHGLAQREAASRPARREIPTPNPNRPIATEKPRVN